MESFVKFLNAIGALIQQLTSSRVILLIVLGFFAVALSFTYENRQIIFTMIINSPFLLTGGIVGVVILILGWMFSSLVSRADERNEAFHRSLEERIAALNQQIIDCRQREEDCTDRFNALLAKLQVKIDD